MNFKFPDCPLPAGASVWAYLRDSGGDGQDLASQRAYLLAYCHHHRLNLVRLFEDGAVSGGSTAGRSEFDLMIFLSRKSSRPAVDGVLYWDVKRFARNQLDSQFFKADLRRRGYKLVSLSDDIPDGPFGTIFENFLEWKAQQDLDDISKDTKRGLSLVVGMRDAAGNYLGLCPGVPPTCFKGEKYDTGLKRNDGRLRIVQRWVPDPESWDRGRRAWEMRAEGASYREIEEECRLFPGVNIGGCYASFFRNEIYIGRLRYGGQTCENFVPAMVSMETWNKVQRRLYRRSATGQPRSKRSEYLLSGLCFCQYCQSAMHGSKNTRSGRTKFWHYYLCAQKKQARQSCESKQVSAARLEQAIIETVTSQILTVDFVMNLVDRVNAILSDADTLEAKKDEVSSRLKGLDRGIANLLDLAEQHGSAAVIDRLRLREMERDTAKRDLERMQEQLGRPSLRVDRKFIVTLLADMRMSLTAEEIDVRKRVLKQVVEKIEVGRSMARLYCKFPVETLDWFMPPTSAELIPCLFYQVRY